MVLLGDYTVCVCVCVKSSHHCSQYEAETEQAERQADGQLGGWGHGAFTTVSWTGETMFGLLTDAITANLEREEDSVVGLGDEIVISCSTSH